MSPSSLISKGLEPFLFQELKKWSETIMASAPISENIPEITLINNKSCQNEPLYEKQTDKTPAKYNQENLDVIRDETGSPILGSTELSINKCQSFLSSTPARGRNRSVTPEPKKSILNVLDQLCSPIILEENETWQLNRPTSVHGNGNKFKSVVSDKKTERNKMPKISSNSCNKFKRSNKLNKSLHEIDASNLNTTDNDLFDDISDISLQVLYEATSHIVDNTKLNGNIRNDSVNSIVNKDGKYEYASNNKIEPILSSSVKHSINNGAERIKSENELIFTNMKLIYSNANVNLDSTPSIYLKDIFSEATFLEEANRSYKKEFKPRIPQVLNKTVQNEPNPFYNILNQEKTDLKCLHSVQCKLEVESNILNNSFGITDTQFCEAVEAVELVSDLDRTMNLDVSDNITENFHGIVEGVHREVCRKSTNFNKKHLNNNENSYLKAGESIDRLYNQSNSANQSFPINTTETTGCKEANSEITETERMQCKESVEKSKNSTMTCVVDLKISHAEVKMPVFQESVCLKPAMTTVPISRGKPFEEQLNNRSREENNLHNVKSTSSNLIQNCNEIQGLKFAKTKEGMVPTDQLINFQDDYCDESKLLLKSFHLSNEKVVGVSEKAIEQSTHFFDDANCKLHFKGFQTANGELKISEETLKKAKHLLNDKCLQKGYQETSGKLTTFTASYLEEDIDSLDHPRCELDSHVKEKVDSGKFDCNAYKSCKNSKNSYMDLSYQSDKVLGGFKIPEQELRKSKHLPSEFCTETKPVLKGFQTAIRREENTTEKSNYLFQNDLNTMQADCENVIGNFTRSVKVSEESLENAKHLFDEEPNAIHKGFQTANGSFKVSEDSLEKAKQLFYDVPHTIQKGFHTASGKSVKVSEESLKKAKNFFDDIPNAIEKVFQTGSGNSVKLSEKSLEKAKQLINDVPHTIQKGFQTENGRSVNVSDESLKKAKQLFDDVPKGHQSIQKGFQSASGKSVNVSEESMKIAKYLFNEEPNTLHRGFQTANGKSVKVSEESLEKAKQLFHDLPHTIQNGFQTASGKFVLVSEKSLEKARHLFNEEPNTIKEGLQTANGKSVNVSEESLKKAKNMFDEEPNTIHKGFKTANGRSVKVTEESLEKAKQLFDDVPRTIQKGFQTASGKSVPVSEKSLEKARHLFDESNTIQKGFQTGNGKIVNVSEQSLEKAKNLFDEEPNAILKGFQTANGKSVKVSEESLEKAKQLFDDVPHTIQKGFHTASGKSVNVSEELLKKAKNLFEDDPTTLQNCSKTAHGKTVQLSEDVIGGGFHSANRKFSKVTEESLKKVRKLLEQTNSESYLSPISNFCKLQGENQSHILEKLSCMKDDLSSKICTEELVLKGFQKENMRQTEGEVNRQGICKQKRKRVDTTINSPSQMNKELNVLTSENQSSGKIYKPYYNSLRKRRKLFTDTDSIDEGNLGEVFCEEEVNIPLIGCSVISEADLSLLNHSRTSLSGNENQKSELYIAGIMSPSVAQEVTESMAALLADEASNSPFTLKPCLSSPGMLYDRQVSLPSIDCYENEVNINNKQLSPVLDSRSKFKKRPNYKYSTAGVSTPVTHLNKTTNTITKTFKPPYATSTPNENQLQSKRKLKTSSFHTNPEKRQKIDPGSESEILCNVQKARLQASQDQEQCVKEKLKNPKTIKPCKGSYLLRKQTEKSLSLKILTENGHLSYFTFQQLINLGIRKSVLETTAKNVMEFKFVATDHFCEETATTNINGVPVGDGALLILDVEGKAGIKEITRAFLASPSIDPSLIPNGWVENHFKWIVLKMAAMERMFPVKLGNRYLTPNNIMLQLKYRYDREVDRSQRPALRKILEKDESPAKTMVLFVADILDAEAHLDREKNLGKKELELSDGWYSVKALIDHEMEVLIRRGKVDVGTKLMITGAEMSGNEAGCTPLETPASVRLRISTNSCHRARWFSRLGFLARGPRPARLREVLGRGGSLPALTATVARVYPVLFLQKVEGKTVIRSERAEQAAADEYQMSRQQCAETILSQLQRDLEMSRPSEKHVVTITSVKHATDTKQLYSLLDGVDDISLLQDVLSKDQLNELKQMKEDEMRRVQQQLQEKLIDQLDKKCAPRNVTRMLKVRLVDEGETSDRSALLTVWNPSDQVMSCMTEGNTLTFHNISAAGYSRFGDLQLTAGKQTKYSFEKHSSCPRRTTLLAELQNSELKPWFSEIDVVGIVIQLTDSSPDKTSRLIYIADNNHNFLGISFWTDLKATGFANTLTPGSLVAASNLHWRSHLVSWQLPSAYATEMSTFSQHPRQPHIQKALQQLRNRFDSMDLSEYMTNCQDRIKSLVTQRNSGGAQPYRSCDGSTATVRREGRSDGCESSSSILNLTKDVIGSILTENVNTPANKRLEMLERYGEPPPISPLTTSTPIRVKSNFRPPMRISSDKR